jgi:hypothetical protein
MLSLFGLVAQLCERTRRAVRAPSGAMPIPAANAGWGMMWERRGVPRVAMPSLPVSVLVGEPDESAWAPAWVLNVSSTGAMLCSPRRLPRGSRLRLRWPACASADGPPPETSARVVWTNSSPAGACAGVRFTQPAADLTLLLASLTPDEPA